LTSVSEEDLKGVGYDKGVRELARRRALVAKEAQCRGVICSGHEAQELRQVLGADRLIITPGIRPEGSEAKDQRRVVTPAVAIEQGADLMVVGRPIRDADDPAEMADQIVAQIATALG
jgi:orotidine-5'-phosphate decarboxylase